METEEFSNILDFEPYINVLCTSRSSEFVLKQISYWLVSRRADNLSTWGEGGWIVLIRPYKFLSALGVSQSYFVFIVVTTRKVLVFVINIYIHVIEAFTL